ncbi:MAG: reverse transcriptase domain-containing protein [Planctomycetia bacterium]|nr:reverse transcriptase domain-containing protein [Planctomycetia bacterium]
MKRYGRLMEQICTPDNMFLAWRKTIRGKRQKRSVIRFEENLVERLNAISDALRRGDYHWGAFRHFKIFDPKEREISVPPLADQIAHHALINICEPIFDRCQLDESFACRRGKGQFRAVALASRNCRAYPWFVKLDARRYFASIHHQTLKSLLARRFKDPLLLHAFSGAIDAYETDHGRGLPIGSLTSQFFANHYLTPVDRYIKCELRLPRYVRYMDDLVFWDCDRARLRAARDAIVAFAHDNLKLALVEKGFRQSAVGLTFLGFKLSNGHVALSSRARLRLRRRSDFLTKRFREHKIDELEFSCCMRSLFEWASHADSLAYRRRILHQR